MPVSIEQLLRDRQAFADDVVVEVPGGEKVTLKDLRDALVPKADMTQATQQSSARARELEQRLLQTQQELAEAIARAPETGDVGKPRTDAANGPVALDYASDPVFGPLYQQLMTQSQQLQAMQQQMQQQQQQAQQQQLQAMQQYYLRQMAELRQQDPTVNLDDVRQFALQNSLRDLHVAYREMHRDKLAQDAEAKGYERGKQEAAKMPYIPAGGRRPVQAPNTQTFQTPEAAEDAAGNDPDILAILRGDQV